ncbi:MAG: NERD domain-containing protein [Methanobacteriaceae archaeon]|jgi:hypothetical protein|nr:NERD domain-containing protein [Candidatus Methanorudis spinitermitis]
MKVVSCKNCGAKYQLDDDDYVKDYECSACAGDLEFLESYPSTSSRKSVSTPKDDLNDSKLVYCTDCGLKYRLDGKDNINDFECSSCYGNLRYANEEYNKELDDGSSQIDDNTSASENELATSPIDKEEKKEQDEKEQTHQETSIISAEKIESANIATSEKQKESALRKSLKGKFLNKVNKEYGSKKTPIATKSDDEKVQKVPQSKDTNIDSKDTKSVQKINKDDSEKVFLKNKDKSGKKSRIRDKISFKRENTVEKKKTTEKKSKQEIKKEKTSTENNSMKTSKKSLTSDKKSKTDKRELVVNPKIKSRIYHDFFIEIGLLIALVGVIDAALTGRRLFSIIFIIIGIIVFLIGLILNKRHRDSKEREKLVRKKLLTLPKDFYVLSYLKLPDTDSRIDHVVVGPTGIFTILTQKYKTKKNKKKPSLAIATYSSFKNTDINVNRNAILNFDKKEKTKFEDNNEVKQKSIQLTKNLIEYLGKNGLNDFYIEPLICFINKQVSIINIVLSDEDLFLEELLTKISNENKKLDYTTLNKCATLLSEYSAESS